MGSHNYYVDTPWTWRDRLRWKFFPSRHCELPPNVPAHWEDVLVVKVTVKLGLVDRLRVLLSGVLVVDSRTVTEHKVGGNIGTSVAYPAWRA
jgi:hypothetical protein